MTSFRTKQIGLALFLMVSLGVGHVSACPCSHHVEKKAVEESDCHSHHESAETVEAVSDGNVCDASCVCFVEQPSPYAVLKSQGKFNTNDKPQQPEQVLPDIEFVALAGSTQILTTFATDRSHSTTLKSLLPSRAPPRL